MSLEKIRTKTAEIKRKLDAMMKDRNYRRQANFAEWKSKNSSQLNICAGELNACREMFSIVARTSAAAIEQGEEEYRDTSLQRDELRNAFLGYVSMDDALFTLKSLNNYDALTFAYESLNLAEKRMKGENARLNTRTFLRRPERGGVRAVLDSEDLEDERIKMYNEIEEELIKNKDVELTLKNYRRKKSEEQKNAKKPNEPASAQVVPPEQNYESDEERQRRVQNEKSRSFQTAPPKIKKEEEE